METLTMQEVKKLSIIQKGLDKVISVSDSAKLLGLSERQVYRLRDAVRRKGALGVVHGNRGREPVNKTPDAVKDTVLRLFVDKYYDFNVNHFTEKLNEDEGLRISRETVRLILFFKKEELTRLGIVFKTKKKPYHKSRRERMPQKGIMIQMDGSYHDWFNNQQKCTLLGLIDDATGEVDGLFVKKETTLGYMHIMKRFFKEKGLPLAFYVDKHSSFKTTRHGGIHVYQNDEHDTQIQRALNELGVNLILAGSPEAKGRIERLFGTFQDRLISELRLAGIKTITDGNRFLKNKFIPHYNKKFSVKPGNNKSAFRPLPQNIDLDRILSIKQQRTVKADNTISIKGKIYQILPDEYRISYTKARVEVCEFTDQTIHVYYKDQELKIQKIGRINKRQKQTLDVFIKSLKPTHPDIIPLQKGDKIALA